MSGLDRLLAYVVSLPVLALVGFQTGEARVGQGVAGGVVVLVAGLAGLTAYEVRRRCRGRPRGPRP